MPSSRRRPGSSTAARTSSTCCAAGCGSSWATAGPSGSRRATPSSTPGPCPIGGRSSGAIPSNSCSWASPTEPGPSPPQLDRRGDLAKEVVALVVHHDEGRKVLHLDLPHRLHPELGVLEHVHPADAVEGQPGRRPP